jgi:hypothetical protein
MRIQWKSARGHEPRVSVDEAFRIQREGKWWYAYMGDTLIGRDASVMVAKKYCRDAARSCPRLDRWGFTRTGGRYDAPETTAPALLGDVTGHPLYPDGDRIRTSGLVAVKGRWAFTVSRVYRLLEPDPEYLEWCEAEGIQFDPDNPLTGVPA